MYAERKSLRLAKRRDAKKNKPLVFFVDAARRFGIAFYFVFFFFFYIAHIYVRLY